MARSSSKYRLRQHRKQKKMKVRKLVVKYKALRAGRLKIDNPDRELTRLAGKIEKRGRDLAELST
jgi:hypothetical protein